MERMERERRTITYMIDLYCKTEHHMVERCDKCEELNKYAMFRLEKCPFQEKKPACQNCKIHCYKPDMKERVKDVMRVAGPKMLIKHPYFAMMHAVDVLRKAPELKRKSKNS
ncbi:MAG: nitrous oxide-stimulated promoter family protein [Bacillaceae bacterium]